MELEIDENKLNKIKEFIEKNERFKGNEDLYDRFVDEVKTRGFIIFNSIDFNDPSSKEYVNKIVSASILQVLKQENRLETESKPTEEVSEKKDLQIQTNRDLLQESANIGDLKRYNMMLQNISLSPNVTNYIKNNRNS